MNLGLNHSNRARFTLSAEARSASTSNDLALGWPFDSLRKGNGKDVVPLGVVDLDTFGEGEASLQNLGRDDAARSENGLLPGRIDVGQIQALFVLGLYPTTPNVEIVTGHSASISACR